MATIHFIFDHKLRFSLRIACFLELCHFLILQTEYSVSETESIYILDEKVDPVERLRLVLSVGPKSIGISYFFN